MLDYLEKNNTSDYLNKSKKRNAKNTKTYQYNCGGFALKTYSWYRPYHCTSSELIDMINYYFEMYHSFKIVYNKLMDYFEECMFEDFEDLISITEEEAYNTDEEVIAFRIFIDAEYCDRSKYFELFDWDFHYAIKKNGRIFNKHGDDVIEEVEYFSEAWYCEDSNYDSETRYYIRKKN